MSREEWRQRMIDAGIPEEVVEATLDGMEDDDFARMKDMGADQIRAELIRAELLKDDEEDTEEDDGAEDEDVDEDEFQDLTEAFNGLKDDLLSAIKEAKSADSVDEVELEIPGIDALSERLDALSERMTSMEAILQDVKDGLDEVRQSEEDRIAAVAKDLSPASKARLRVHRTKDGGMSDDDAQAAAAQIRNWFSGNGPQADPNALFVDANGRQYRSFGEMMTSAE